MSGNDNDNNDNVNHPKIDTRSEDEKKLVNQIVDDLEQSEKQFTSAFNPESGNYHNGVQTVVPTHDTKKLPTTMPSEQPDGFDPNLQQEEIDQGPDYQKLMKDREQLNAVKKTVNKVCPAMKKVSELIVEISATDDQLNKESWTKKLGVARKELSDIRTLVQEYNEQNYGKFDVVVKDVFNALLEKSADENLFNQKETYGNLMIDLNHKVKNIFKVQTDMLNEIKLIKKNHNKE